MSRISCNAAHSRSVSRDAVRTIRWKTAFVAFAAVFTACASRPESEPLSISISVPPGDVASAVSWSPDKRCGALMVSNRDGHSPLTTTRVAIVEPGASGYREIRLPEPNEGFSTVFDRWEGAGVLRLHATTLDQEVAARYSCSSRQLEIIK
jgi:hypothetical protein